MKDERKKTEEENKKRVKTKEEIEADKIRKDKKEKENINRCLSVAESNKKYFEQKDQKIKEIKELNEKNSNSAASKLREALLRSKKSYKLNKNNVSKLNMTSNSK